MWSLILERAFGVAIALAILGFVFTAIAVLDKRGWLPWPDDLDDDHRGGLG